jgi:phage FluMu protein Com
MSQIVKSLLIVFLISSSISGITFLFYPSFNTLIQVLIGITGLQILFFFLYNNILRYIARLNLEKEAIQLSQLAEQNRILAECQKCKKMNNVYITLTEENEFECDECDTINKIIIDINTVLPTKIIYDK